MLYADHLKLLLKLFLASTEAESRTNPKSGEEVDLGRTQGEEKDRCRDTYDG
jgi:hypothetical protein